MHSEFYLTRDYMRLKYIHLGICCLFIYMGCGYLNTTSNANRLNYEYLIKEGKLYWEKRANPKSAKMAVLFFEKAFELNPQNFELTVSLSRACYFQGYYIEIDPAKRDTLYLKGANAALTGFQNTAYFQSFVDTTSIDNSQLQITAIRKAPVETIPALYWWAANFGRYLTTKPVLTRIESREIIETAMHRIATLDEDYYYGGPTRFFGTFYSRLPGVPLDRAKRNFDQSLADSPDYLGTRVLRARYYHTKLGNRDLFEEDLNYVINADPSVLPDAMPENLFEQEKAKELLKHTSILFE